MVHGVPVPFLARGEWSEIDRDMSSIVSDYLLTYLPIVCSMQERESTDCALFYSFTLRAAWLVSDPVSTKCL